MQFLKLQHSNSLKALVYIAKQRPEKSAVCIGETNAINLELFLAPDYYQATMERYEEIKLNDGIFAFLSPLARVV